jgi:hypothetical protein
MVAITNFKILEHFQNKVIEKEFLSWYNEIPQLLGATFPRTSLRRKLKWEHEYWEKATKTKRKKNKGRDRAGDKDRWI